MAQSCPRKSSHITAETASSPEQQRQHLFHFFFPLEPSFNEPQVANSVENHCSLACDEHLYQTVQQCKEQFDHPKFLEARNATNPYERLGRGRFSNRAALKLAAIDRLFGLILQQNNNSNQQPLWYADLAGGPGSWVEYVQHCRPNSVGFGMSLSQQTVQHNSLTWKLNHLPYPDRFTVVPGEDGSGDLLTQWSSFVKAVPRQLDVVLADGGVDVDTAGMHHRQEQLNSPLIFSELLVALQVLRVGGHFLFKCFDMVTVESALLLQHCRRCFRHVVLTKPVTSRPANSERYVVCLEFLGSSDQSTQNVLAQLTTLSGNQWQFPAADLSPSVIDTNIWEQLVLCNGLSLSKQLLVCQRILAHLDHNSTAAAAAAAENSAKDCIKVARQLLQHCWSRQQQQLVSNRMARF